MSSQISSVQVRFGQAKTWSSHVRSGQVTSFLLRLMVS